MTEREVPSYFAAFIAEYFGERGAAWLVELPDLLAQYARRWELELLPPFAGLTFHYVAPVVRADGSPAVLKVGMLEEEARTGIAFLRQCSGDGAVCLLEADTEHCALLMERAFPGNPLTRLEDDDEATGIAAEVMRALWRLVPATHSFITVGRRLRAFARMREMHGGGAGPLSEGMLSRAEKLAIEMLASAPYERVLHGDLHHDNIVAAQRAPWLVIDPKGIVGDPGYETGALILLRQKTPPFRAGDEWRPGSPYGRLSAVPQGLREWTPVERERHPSSQCSCQPVTASVWHVWSAVSSPGIPCL